MGVTMWEQKTRRLLLAYGEYFPAAADDIDINGCEAHSLESALLMLLAWKRMVELPRHGVALQAEDLRRLRRRQFSDNSESALAGACV